jgi:putative ABC transport system permease protein
MEEFFGIIAMDDLAILLLVFVGAVVLLLLVLGWRNRVMLRLGLRNIPRRRAQTALIVFGLMLSTLIVAAAFGTGDTLSYSFRSLALDDLGQVDELVNKKGGAVFVTLEMEFGENQIEAQGSTRGSDYFDVALFESLADQIAGRQDATARLVEGLTPIIDQGAGPVINRTAKQSEATIAVVGYDAATADAFDDLHRLDGVQVSVADLGPGEVYLNEGAAKQLSAAAGHELVVYLQPDIAALHLTVRGVVKPGGLPGQLIMPLDQLQRAVGQQGKINNILVSNVGDPYEGKRYSTAVRGLLEDLLPGRTLAVQEVKRMYLFGAELLGSLFTTMFIGFGSFSIAAALLLIFLIFVMLAAERKREMGMARAVGTRRRHLVQMFVFEGTAYDLVAAAVGALLGAVVGLVTVGILTRSLENINGLGSFGLRHHLEPRSVIVAYCLGVLLTFVTVAVSAWRVSRLNIVSAIRDLPPPVQPDAGLRALIAEPWRHLVDAFRQLLRVRPHRTLKRLLWDGPRASLAFFWALVGRGPLTVLVGLLGIRLGQSARNLFAFHLGVSLVLIGVGLTLRWVLRARVRTLRPETRDRLAFSFAGITLLIYWSLPFDALDALGVSGFSAGPEMFVLAGVMMVAGAVWTIVYNSDLLLHVVTRLLSPFGKLLPVVRTAIAYPMYSKFRTGLTIAMFALVIFMLVFMSVFVNMISDLVDEEAFAQMEEFDIQAHVLQSNPIPDLRAAIATAPDLNAGDYVRIERDGTRSFPLGGGNSFAVYDIKLADGVDPRDAAQALEAAFIDHGLVTEVFLEELQAAKSMMSTMFSLMQAFMGLGLIVGSASIGIVSTRAVVERRQQIGVLRAIGYKPWMIQWSFLLEASFVALLGILLGIGLGLILAYNFYNGELASTPGGGLSFSIPWATLGIVVAFAYLVSMLTTYLPSWQAGRIYPAEALRYE